MTTDAQHSGITAPNVFRRKYSNDEMIVTDMFKPSIAMSARFDAPGPGARWVPIVEIKSDGIYETICNASAPSSI
jgi:hypothetical protein